MEEVVFDTECYINYWLLAIRSVRTGAIRHFERTADCELDSGLLRQVLSKYRFISFNGRNYDAPMIALALGGASNGVLKAASDLIITKGMRPWEFERHFSVKIPTFDHIDVMEVAPGMGSLKIYGGRLHTKRMQDLPIEPDAVIADDQRALLRQYCENDLQVTQELFSTLRPQIELRAEMSKQYGLDLRSKSDAQIAEAVIKHEVEAALGVKIERPVIPPGTSFKYDAPDYLQFETQQLRDVLRVVKEANFVIGDGSKAKNKIKDDDGNDIAAKGGNVEMPAAIGSLKITIGTSTYQMGIGGLHSTEKRVARFSDDDRVLIDADVASYYPNLIRTLKLYPSHIGDPFAKVYSNLISRRLEAKRNKDKVVDSSLKLTLNSSYGKFGSKWSTLFAPKLMIQTTMTGQLALLMLIERIELNGISVISANTDGIVSHCPRNLIDTFRQCLRWWEQRTGLEMEETQYKALYSQNVNTYIAVKSEGAKTKGLFATGSLAKNPVASICVKAVTEHLVNSTPIAQTVYQCADIREFVTVRTVRGGGRWGDEYLGKTVRWYYSIFSDTPIRYVTNGNKVPKSDGCQPCMELPDSMPYDVDLNWYVREAEGILKDIGL